VRRTGPRRGAGRAAAAVLGLALLGGLAGCGKEGPPAPPLRLEPAPAKDLTVQQRGTQVLLELVYPNVTPSGVALGGITGLEVWDLARPAPRAGDPQPIDPRQYEAAAQVVHRLGAPDLPLATVGDRLVVRLPAPAAAPEAPVAHHYVVRTLGPRGDRSGPSNQAILVTQEPPPAPEELNAIPSEEGVEITWLPPARGGEAIKGFHVYRRDSTVREVGKPLAALPPTASRYLDATARFGASYIYAVTSVARTAPVVESAVAAEREVRYLDRFPPPPPEDLVALAESGPAGSRVRLIWRSSPAPDLAGYVVYRREGEGPRRRLNPEPLLALELTDTEVAAGATYLYVVTAVDLEGNESAPGPEATAAVPP
jgi:hypothetical protein